MTILSALERLQLQPSLLHSRTLSRPIDPTIELATFLSTAGRLTMDARPVRPIDVHELSEIRARCRSSNYDLSQFNKREIAILLRDDVTVLAPRFLSNVKEAIRTRTLRISLMPLIAIYFERWGSLSSQRELEDLIREALQIYGLSSPTLLKYKAASLALFSPGADKFLACEALRVRVSVASILETWSIGATTALGRGAVNAAVREYIPDLRLIEKQAYTPQACESLEFLTSKLLSSELLEPALLYSALSMVVLSKWTEISDDYRRRVLQFILHDRRLGNPRFPDKFPNWTPFDPRVIQQVRSWLAREDMVFFFDFVLPDTQDKHHRKEFWLQYLDLVDDSQVALCQEDRMRLRAQVSEQMAYSNMKDAGVSAFLLRFKSHESNPGSSLFNREEVPDTVVVEFSQVGNAVYFYEAKVFKAKVGDFWQKLFSIASLKRKGDRLQKIDHNPIPPGQWQYKVRNFLAGRGVRLG
jgi:hypothetical protein